MRCWLLSLDLLALLLLGSQAGNINEINTEDDSEFDFHDDAAVIPDPSLSNNLHQISLMEQNHLNRDRDTILDCHSTRIILPDQVFSFGTAGGSNRVCKWTFKTTEGYYLKFSCNPVAPGTCRKKRTDFQVNGTNIYKYCHDVPATLLFKTNIVTFRTTFKRGETNRMVDCSVTPIKLQPNECEETRKLTPTKRTNNTIRIDLDRIPNSISSSTTTTTKPPATSIITKSTSTTTTTTTKPPATTIITKSTSTTTTTTTKPPATTITTTTTTTTTTHRWLEENDCDMCGMKKTARIIGGNAADENEYPWQVGLVINKMGKHHLFCGGTIINRCTVLTAAHCVIDYVGTPHVINVWVGGHIFGEDGDLMEVKEIHRHMGYIKKIHQDVIAIIILKKELVFDFARIGLICLPANDEEYYECDKATAIGWGRRDPATPAPPMSPLHEVELEIMTDKECKRCYVYRQILCTTTIDLKDGEIIHEGFCKGDSGGPLMVQDEGKRYTQVGVISAGCAFPLPDVYARVSEYLDHIRDKFKTDFCPPRK